MNAKPSPSSAKCGIAARRLRAARGDFVFFCVRFCVRIAMKAAPDTAARGHAGETLTRIQGMLLRNDASLTQQACPFERFGFEHRLGIDGRELHNATAALLQTRADLG